MSNGRVIFTVERVPATVLGETCHVLLRGSDTLLEIDYSTNDTSCFNINVKSRGQKVDPERIRDMENWCNKMGQLTMNGGMIVPQYPV